MIFEYQARDKKNNLATGFIEALNEKVALEILKDRGLFIVELREKKRSVDILTSLEVFNRIKRQHIVVFTRQLAVMASATLPIIRALRILIQQTANPRLKMIVSDVAAEVEGGSRLSVALSHHPRVFSEFYVKMIESGEVSGRSEQVLNYLADQEEKDYDLISKIKGAMIYPVFLICGLVVVGSLMMVFVIPKLTKIIEEAAIELPLSTKILIAVSNFLASYWWIIFIFLLLLVIGFRIALRMETFRKGWDLLKLKVPIFGNLFQKIYLIRFTKSLSTLIIGGVTLTQGLEITKDVVGNRIYKDLVARTIEEVEDGNSIVTVFIKSKEIPPMLSQMMSVGEQTGRLSDILEKTGNFYSREIEGLIANLTSLIEPLILVVMGIAIGVMVAAIMMPMYNLASAF